MVSGRNQLVVRNIVVLYVLAGKLGNDVQHPGNPSRYHDVVQMTD